ncbi:MAG: hypothetical protein JWP87_4442 [Labilithrix sp.]|nr:hypothetical protein [Labilithrix sp.]
MRLVARLGGGLLFAATAATTTLVVVACAKGTDSVDVDEGGVVEEDAARDVNVVPLPSKDSSSPDDSGPLPGDDSGTCTRKVVVNEVLMNGPSGSEFIELYNASTCAVPMGDWKISYKSGSNAAGGATYTFATGASLAPKAFFVIATANFSGAKNATFNGGLSNSDGQVGLLDDKKATVDAVGWGTGTAGDYTEGAPVPLPPTNSSVARNTDGVDTNDNKADFKTATPSAGQPN